MSSSTSWWGGKTRQFRAHLRATVRPSERHELATWLAPAQVRLFEAMHVADQRHGLDVVASLRAQGVSENDVLLAGLLHDAGKGGTGLWPRVAWSLSEHYGHWILRAAGVLPGFRPALARIRDHAEVSARMAAAAGCSSVTVELIRHQSSPVDPRYGELLRLADEAN